MNPAFAAFAFAGGATLGSFISVVAHRIPRGESFARGRSRCPHCGHTVAAYDNVPIASWLLLRGRCRSCSQRISARYPAAEVGLGTLYAATLLALGTGDGAELALGLVLCTVLVAVTFTDLELRIVPNQIVAAGAVLALVIAAVGDPASMPERLIAGAGAGLFMLVVALAYPRGMGMGDVKLAGMMGLFLGSSVVPALAIGFASGAAVGIALIAMHGSEARKRAVPFAPFLALGGVLALWFGDSIISWYTSSFFGG